MKITPTPDRANEPQPVPCAVRDMDIVIAIQAKGVPYGVDRRHVVEYLAAFVEDREPVLHEDILDCMPDIQATILCHTPPDLPVEQSQDRPCGVCGGFGYRLDQHERTCPCKREAPHA